MTDPAADDETAPRVIDLEVVVLGTPEQVWDAIATTAGVSSWMQPTEIDPRPGGRYSFDLHDGAGSNNTGSVVAAESPTRFSTAGVVWSATGDGSEVELATEWTVRARDAETCVVRMVMSGFGRGQAWDDEVGGMTTRLRQSLRALAAHLHSLATHSDVDDPEHAGATGLSDVVIGAVIPVSDLTASIGFYQTALGLTGSPAPSGYRLHAGAGSVMYLLAGTGYPGRAEWPLASVAVDDIERAVDVLVRRGVEPVRDVPYEVDARGIADLDGMRIAWIVDPDDQVISLFELTD